MPAAEGRPARTRHLLMVLTGGIGVVTVRGRVVVGGKAAFLVRFGFVAFLAAVVVGSAAFLVRGGFGGVVTGRGIVVVDRGTIEPTRSAPAAEVAARPAARATRAKAAARTGRRCVMGAD